MNMAPRLPTKTPASFRRYIALWQSAAWGLVAVIAVVAPFALAGATGNSLWIAAPVVLTLVYVAARETPRCLAYYRSLWPTAWRAALIPAGGALMVTLGI